VAHGQVQDLRPRPIDVERGPEGLETVPIALRAHATKARFEAKRSRESTERARMKRCEELERQA